MSDLRILQQKHRMFIMEMGWAYSKTPLESVALICEEIGELTHELRQPVIDKNKSGDEMADIILRTIDLAGEMGVDIQDAVEGKIQHNLENVAHHKAKGRRL